MTFAEVRQGCDRMLQCTNTHAHMHRHTRSHTPMLSLTHTLTHTHTHTHRLHTFFVFPFDLLMPTGAAGQIYSAALLIKVILIHNFLQKNTSLNKHLKEKSATLKSSMGRKLT